MKYAEQLREANPVTRQRIQLGHIGPYVNKQRPFTVSNNLFAVWRTTLDQSRNHYVIFAYVDLPLFIYDATGKCWYGNSEFTKGSVFLRIQNIIAPEGCVSATIPTFDTKTLQRVIQVGMGVIVRERLLGKPAKDDWRNEMRKILDDYTMAGWATNRHMGKTLWQTKHGPKGAKPWKKK